MAEVARDMPDIDIIVNVQGDEPEISGAAIDVAIEMLGADIPTPSCRRWPRRFAVAEQLEDPACVKVVCDSTGAAMYFSRSPIPHLDNGTTRCWRPIPRIFCSTWASMPIAATFLAGAWPTLPPRRWKQIERLEQLRVLAAGHHDSGLGHRGTDGWNRHARGLPGVCQSELELLRYSPRVDRPGACRQPALRRVFYPPV